MLGPGVGSAVVRVRWWVGVIRLPFVPCVGAPLCLFTCSKTPGVQTKRGRAQLKSESHENLPARTRATIWRWGE